MTGTYASKRESNRLSERSLLELISRSEDPSAAYSILTDRIQTMTDAGVRPEPHWCS